MQKSSSKTAPGQDLAQNGRFQTFPKGSFSRDLEGCQNAKFELQKGSWSGFCPKGHFPMISRRTFFLVTWKPPKGSWSGFGSNWLFPCIPKNNLFNNEVHKGVLARTWPKMVVSRHSDDKTCLSPHPIECLVVSSSALGTTLKHTKVLSA